MIKLVSNKVHLENEIWGKDILTFLNNYNPFKGLKPTKEYQTSNRDGDYLNYIYRLNDKTYGYLQLKGKRYGEVFRVTTVKVEACTY